MQWNPRAKFKIHPVNWETFPQGRQQCQTLGNCNDSHCLPSKESQGEWEPKPASTGTAQDKTKEGTKGKMTNRYCDHKRLRRKTLLGINSRMPVTQLSKDEIEDS